MSKPTLSLLLGIIFCASVTPVHAQNPRATYIPPFKITVDPAVFRKGQPVTPTVSFTAPAVCSNHGLVLRAYEINDASGEPTFDTKYLAQTWTTEDPTPSSKVNLGFEPLIIPANAGDRVYMVLWSWCEVRIPKGIDPTTGDIIWQIKLSGQFVGGASFHFTCPSRTEVCGYRPE
jgi:hypothetical protein